MRPAAGIAFGPVMSLQDGGLLPYEPPKLFQIVKMDALAAAMEGAFKATDTLPRDFAAWRARAQISCLIYDDIMSRSHGDEQKPSPKQE